LGYKQAAAGSAKEEAMVREAAAKVVAAAAARVPYLVDLVGANTRLSQSSMLCYHTLSYSCRHCRCGNK